MSEPLWCSLCNDWMTEKALTILVDTEPPSKIINVPGHECEACGERLYSGEVSIKLDDIGERIRARKFDSEVTAYVYNFDKQPAKEAGDGE